MTVFSRARCLAVLAVTLAGLAAVPVAAADGDPASDYLITQPMFVPFGNDTTKPKAVELERLLVNARSQGFGLKVAVIASPYDLGSVPVLYRQPQRYADFLGEEDVYFFRQELLVVMPNGYGLYKANTGVPAGDKQVVAALPSPGTTNGDLLIAAAERAVHALAVERGLTITATGAVKPHGGSSGGSGERYVLLAVAFALVAVGLGGLLVLRLRGRRAAA